MKKKKMMKKKYLYSVVVGSNLYIARIYQLKKASDIFKKQEYTASYIFFV